MISDLQMTCKSVYVKQDRSGNLKAVLKKIIKWEQLTWEITGLGQPQSGVLGKDSGSIIRQRTSALRTSGVYNYSLKIQKDDFNESCVGKLLVYSKWTLSSSD